MMLKYAMNLDLIQNPIKELLERTDTIIKNSIQSSIELIDEMNYFTPVLKGKKIRSTLFFLLAEMCNVSTGFLPNAAAAIEIFHLSSLVHDDIIDNSILRRGEKTLNARFGNHVSVLGGDFLFINSLMIMSDIDEKRFMNVMLEAAKSMVEGQILEAGNTFNYAISEETYTGIISKKTSALFGAVSKMISVLRNDDTDMNESFYEFGLNFGAMFQISDDLLDIFSDKAGKEQFNDLREGKVTLPYILLLKEINDKEENNFTKWDKQDLIRAFKEKDIKNKSLEIINDYYEKCKIFLNNFKESEYKSILLNILDFIREREY